VFWGLGSFCIKGLWFFDVFARSVCAGTEIWADLGERVRRENSKFKMQNAKLRNADVVGMGVFIAGGREKADLRGRGMGSVQRGADGVLRIGFVLGLFFWVGRGRLLLESLANKGVGLGLVVLGLGLFCIIEKRPEDRGERSEDRRCKTEDGFRAGRDSGWVGSFDGRGWRFWGVGRLGGRGEAS